MKYLSMAALAMVGAVMTGCSSDDNIIDEPQQPANTDNVVTLTTTISLDGGTATTRALTADGVKTFAEGETMALVYQNTDGATVKAVSAALPDGDYGQSATFTFTLTNPDKAKDVTYIYPAAMANSDGTVNYAALDTQDGTLATLSSSLDLATKTAAWDAGSLPTATLDNQLAILALTLKDEAGTSDITSTITGLTLSDGTYNYAVTRSAAAGPIYVAIRTTSSASIAVTATDGTFDYSKSLTDKTYEASNGYNVSWRMTNVTPLTMEALTAGTIVVSNPKSGMQYSLNGGAKTAMTETTTINVSKGDKVQFYGKDTDISQYGGDKKTESTSIYGGSAEVKAYGNIMSLMDETGFATNTTLPADYAIAFLFYRNANLKDASGLLLPATTLTNSCYKALFYECTSLTAVPALPAKNLDDNCYIRMFYGCTSLTTAPALPAKTMKRSCYEKMFYGCTSLTTAPALPATTLSTFCYDGMFSGCTGLTTAPALPSTALKNYCYDGMFSGCTGLTTAPTLPAKTLVSYCYHGMFNGCTNLSAVTCLATNISTSNCTYNWLGGVAESGTFTTPSSTTWTTGEDGIPSGWTRKNAK